MGLRRPDTYGDDLMLLSDAMKKGDRFASSNASFYIKDFEPGYYGTDPLGAAYLGSLGEVSRVAFLNLI